MLQRLGRRSSALGLPFQKDCDITLFSDLSEAKYKQWMKAPTKECTLFPRAKLWLQMASELEPRSCIELWTHADGDWYLHCCPVLRERMHEGYGSAY